MNQKPQPEPITITVDEQTEQISLSHYKKVLSEKDTVLWQCDHPFLVHLGPRSPLEKMSYQHFQGNPEGGMLKASAPDDIYRYLVVVLYGGKFLTLDPDLVVRR